jgi:uncharacterized protein (DUF58 family)
MHPSARVRLTADGAAALVLAVLLLLVAVNLQAGWMFAVDALLWAAVGVAGVGAWTAVRGLQVSRRMPAEVSEGDEMSITLTVSLRRGRRYALVLRDAIPGGGTATLTVPEVGGRPVSLTYRAVARTRGVHRVEDVEVMTSGLLGLVSARRRVSAPAEVVVLPRFWVLSQIPSPGPAGADSEAVHRPRRDGLEVAGVRDYRDGDSLRHVHWRSTARRGRLVVREFDDDLREPVAVLLDTRPALYADAPDAFEDLVRAAASVAHLATRTGRPVVLVGAAGSQAHPLPWPKAVRWLAAVQPGGDRTPLDQLSLLAAGTRVVVATADADVLLQLARRAVPVAAILVDASAYRRGTDRRGDPAPDPSVGAVLALQALGVPVAVLGGGTDPAVVLARWGS